MKHDSRYFTCKNVAKVPTIGAFFIPSFATGTEWLFNIHTVSTIVECGAAINKGASSLEHYKTNYVLLFTFKIG